MTRWRFVTEMGSIELRAPTASLAWASLRERYPEVEVTDGPYGVASGTHPIPLATLVAVERVS